MDRKTPAGYWYLYSSFYWAFLACAAAGYLLIMFPLSGMLPARFSFDSAMLSAGADESILAGSYASTLYVFSFVPTWLQMPVIACFGISAIALIGGVAVRNSGLFVAFIWLVPLLTMGLMRPQKEILVYAVSLLCMMVVSHVRRPSSAFLLIFGLYCWYAFGVRMYFVMILGVFAFVWLLISIAPTLRAAALLFAASFLMLIPTEYLSKVQSVRDAMNDDRNFGIGVADRTAFYNPFDERSIIGFIGNYAYAFAQLNLPIVFEITAADIFLFVSMLVNGMLIYVGLRIGTWRTKMLTALFLSHLLVLWLFEPDRGSYLRHVSSVYLYMVPALLAWQANISALPHWQRILFLGRVGELVPRFTREGRFNIPIR